MDRQSLVLGELQAIGEAISLGRAIFHNIKGRFVTLVGLQTFMVNDFGQNVVL